MDRKLGRGALDVPDLSHVVLPESTLPKDFPGHVSADEPGPLLVPRSKDLVVVLSLVLGERPRDGRRLDRGCLVELSRNQAKEKGEVSAGAGLGDAKRCTPVGRKATYEVHGRLEVTGRERRLLEDGSTTLCEGLSKGKESTRLSRQPARPISSRPSTGSKTASPRAHPPKRNAAKRGDVPLTSSWA